METVASAALGAILSVLFSVIPGFKDWYEEVSPNEKRVLMVGALAVVSVGTLALSCFGSPISGVTCTRDAAVSLLLSFFTMATANQVTYSFTPRKTDKPEAKESNSKVALIVGIVLVALALLGLLALLAFVVPAG